MKSGPFDEYIERRFVSELRDVRASALDRLKTIGLHGPDKCSHHQVPLSRLLPLHPRIPFPDTRPHFLQALYLATLLHQAVYHHAVSKKMLGSTTLGNIPCPPCWSSYLLGPSRGATYHRVRQLSQSGYCTLLFFVPVPSPAKRPFFPSSAPFCR